MAQTIYVGLALTSHDSGRLATATFDYVATAGVSRTARSRAADAMGQQ